MFVSRVSRRNCQTFSTGFNSDLIRGGEFGRQRQGRDTGGPQEAVAAAWVARNMTKPVVAHNAGRSAPKGRKIGHMGVIISAFGESAQGKAEILSAAGTAVAPNPKAMGSTMAQALAVDWEPWARPEPDPSRRQFQGAGGGDSDTI